MAETRSLTLFCFWSSLWYAVSGSF